MLLILVVFSSFYSFAYISLTLAQEPVLSCNVALSCIFPDMYILHMSDTTNAHAEIVPTTTYPYELCCSLDQNGNELSFDTNCDYSYNTLLKLSSISNAHASQTAGSPYTTEICLSSDDPKVAGLRCLPEVQQPCPADYTCVVSLSSSFNEPTCNTI